MNIHQEKEIKNVKDGQLFIRLLSYAKPYWKIILFSFILTGLIVVATLAQPYLIKVAIDDYINGISLPMVKVEEGEIEAARQVITDQGGKIKAVIEREDATYMRVFHADFEQLQALEGIEKVQIISVENNQLLVEGWHQVLEAPEMRQEGQQVWMVLDGQEYLADRLTEEQIQSFRSGDTQGFFMIGIIFLIAVGSAATLTYFQNNYLQFTGQSIIYDIRQQMFQHLSKMSMNYFDKSPVGRLVTRVTHDTEALNQLYSQVIVNMVKEILILIGIVIIMFQMSVKLTLLTFTMIPLLVGMTYYFKRIIREAHRYTRAVLSRLNSYLAENLSGIRIIQLFTREKKQLEQFDELNEEHYRAGMRATTYNSIFNPAIGFLGNVALALLVWYGAKSLLAGATTFGVVYAFTHYVRQFYQPLMALADRYNQIQTSMASAERVFETLEEVPAIVNRPEAKRLPEKLQGAIQFKNVWFAYEAEDWVLKDVSFEVKPGETVAFVGATGAGKSSIISLINRFYEIQKGSITIDGYDVRDVLLEDLRKRVGIIQQDPFIFTGDINYNIRLNRTDLSEDDIRTATSSIQLDEFIQHLPEKYQTPMGEQGVSLSGGQRQLLSFLRAFVYRPDILILDEATANIDTETEELVQKAIKKISQGRTTLIVAHRLSTIQHADKIIVLHKGQIRESGNHDQLLKQKGLYHRLYQLQNKEQDLSVKTSDVI